MYISITGRQKTIYDMKAKRSWAFLPCYYKLLLSSIRRCDTQSSSAQRTRVVKETNYEINILKSNKMFK